MRYLVNVYKALSNTVEIEAESEEDAIDQALAMDDLEWKIEDASDEQAEVVGIVDANGKRHYDLIDKEV